MEVYFYVVGFFGLICSLCVITVKNPVYSVLVFCFTTCLILLFSLDFLGFIFIVVYVGAIAVLFLFVVMMLNIKITLLFERSIGILLFGIFIILSFLFNCYFFYFDSVVFNLYHSLYVDKGYILMLENNTIVGGLGHVLYTHFGFSFLLAGLVLLLGMVGTICLTLYHSSYVRRQEVYKQVGRSLDNVLFLKKKKK
jgi:NADH-quinone oxidoreductase subunit J